MNTEQARERHNAYYRDYRSRNRDKYNAYQREYMRKMRAERKREAGRRIAAKALAVGMGWA